MDRRKLLLVVSAVVAVLGVALVFVYAKGADARAADKFETTEVLVAAKKVNPGESFDDALSAGKIVKQDVTEGQILDGASASSDPFGGKLALTTIYPGEQLVPVKFGGAGDVEAAATLPLPEGKLAISILVNDDGRVGKFLSPGAQVAIIFTDIDRATGEPEVSRVLLESVTLLAAGSTSSLNGDSSDTSSADAPGAKSEEEIQQLLTLAVTQRQAEQLRFGEKDGELTAALINGASEVDETDDGVNEENLFDHKNDDKDN